MKTCPRWAVWPFSFRELHCNTLQTLKFVWMAGPDTSRPLAPRLFYFCVLLSVHFALHLFFCPPRCPHELCPAPSLSLGTSVGDLSPRPWAFTTGLPDLGLSSKSQPSCRPWIPSCRGLILTGQPTGYLLLFLSLRC